MSNEINTGGSAFPTTQYSQHIRPTGYAQGMTLRDYFAAKAVQAIIAKNPPLTQFEMGDGSLAGPTDNQLESLSNAVADGAYSYADAMLAAREKGGAA